MKAKGIFAAACFALYASATPILAADVDIPPEPIADWTGLHIGVGLGGNFMFADVNAFGEVLENDLTNNNYYFNASAESNSDLGKAGLFGTVEAGYDIQIGSNLVLGIVGNYDFGRLKAKSSS